MLPSVPCRDSRMRLLHWLVVFRLNDLYFDWQYHLFHRCINLKFSAFRIQSQGFCLILSYSLHSCLFRHYLHNVLHLHFPIIPFWHAAWIYCRLVKLISLRPTTVLGTKLQWILWETHWLQMRCSSSTWPTLPHLMLKNLCGESMFLMSVKFLSRSFINLFWANQDCLQGGKWSCIR